MILLSPVFFNKKMAGKRFTAIMFLFLMICSDRHHQIVVVIEIKSADRFHVRFVVVSVFGAAVDAVDECDHDRETIFEIRQ